MKKNIILSTSLALLLGIGVAVGAHQQETAKAEAGNSYGSDWWITGTVGGKSWGNFQKISTHNEELGRYEITLTMTTSSEFKIYNHAAYGDFELNRSSSKLDYEHKGWLTYTDWVSGDNFKMKEAGDFVIWFDEYIEDYDDVEWAFGIEKASEPVEESHYKYAINGVVAAEEMTKGTGTEYVSKSLSFKKGDVVSFKKDDEAYAVTPKEDSRLTKVYSTEDGLKFAEDYNGVLYLETNGAKLWVGQFTPGYYLVGVDGEWNAKLGIPAVKEAEGDSYAVTNVTLTAGTEFKFVQAPESANEFVWRSAVEGRTSTSSEVAYKVVQSEDESNGNFKVTYAGTYNIYFNPTDEGWYSIEEQNYAPVEGYFIMGSASGVDHWKYNNPVAKMDNTSQGGNVARLMNQSFAVGDQIRIRSYYADQDPKVRWAELGTTGVDYGKKTGDNFEFTKAGAYDIYAKYVESVLYFYVAEHVATYTIQMNAVHFTGNGESSTTALGSQLAYEGQVFNPEVASETDYITVGVYTDEECVTAYEPKAFTADGTLYVKYVKHGFYLTGDDTFLGEGHGWKVEYSRPIGPKGDDKLYGGVVVPEGVSADEPMEVKPLEFVADAGEGKPGWGSASYTMGHDSEHLPDFVHIDNGKNFVFTKPGSYAFYINQEDKVWFNGGAEGFYAEFLSSVGATCDAQGKDTPVNELSTLWKNTIANDYLKLSEEERNNLRDNYTINSGDEKSEQAVLRFIAMYHYVVTKYGTELFPDFVWGQSYEPSSSNINPINPVEESTNSTIIIVVAASITALSFGLLIAIKKKRR